jgi:uncharacterized protein
MDGLILTHGAGSNAEAPLLKAVDAAFTAAGFTVERVTLAFRQKRPKGSPHPSDSAADREGLRSAVDAMRKRVDGRVFLGGHSYGGRQASMLAAEDPSVADALLLLAYPLHPPDKPQQLRVAHFPALLTPSLFVSGASDPFATEEELRTAIKAIPGPVEVLVFPRVGHDLKYGSGNIPQLILAKFTESLAAWAR